MWRARGAAVGASHFRKAPRSTPRVNTFSVPTFVLFSLAQSSRIYVIFFIFVISIWTRKFQTWGQQAYYERPCTVRSI